MLLAEPSSEKPQSPPVNALDAAEARAAATRSEAARIDPPPALIVLAQRLGLKDFERDTLLLAASVEYDPSFLSLFSRVQGNASRTFPTFGIALNALDGGTWDALSPQRPLRQDRLLELSQSGSTPLTSSPLRADERIVSFLKGLNIMDDRLLAAISPVDVSNAETSPSQNGVVEDILQRLHDSVKASLLPIIQLTGSDEGSKIAVAAQVCESLRRQLYRVNAETLPRDAGEIENLSRLWQRETFLLPVGLYIDATRLDGASAEAHNVLVRFLSRGPGLVFLSVAEGPLKLEAPAIPVEVCRPAASEQYETWNTLLTSPSAAALLSGQFDLNLAEIRQAAALAEKMPESNGDAGQRAWIASRDLSRPRLDNLAVRLDAKATWNDLVLADEQAMLLKSIAGQVRGRHTVYDDWGFSTKMNRGFGITALFTGESGTGKTTAAEVLANDLQLNLYRIDLSAVVSKYLGETEKNLRRVFDAAEQGGAILFFDEADALFGKRSEVKDSHDRYANIEINYLLQRMESFSGLAILATNMKSALDQAFMRRLRFVVNFSFPAAKERKLIWQKSFPAQTPAQALDFDRLARLNVSGGNIHSIVLNADFSPRRTSNP